jgi:hypothetical protein
VITPQAAAVAVAPRRASARGWILLALVASLAIYAAGAAPTVLNRDSGELQAVALTGGVAHTTGYPTFAMVGWVFGKLLPGDPAGRINLMSASFGAISLALLVVIGAELSLAPAVAFAGAILYGAGFTFWAAALRAEVYTLAVTLFLLAYWRTLVALRTDRPRDRVVAAVLLGLTLTGHLASAPVVAVLGLSLAWRSLRLGRALREWPLLVLGLVLGLTPYLHIVWADTHGAPVNYLHHVDKVFFPETAVPTGRFASPWFRLLWLVTGLNDAPGASPRFVPWNVLRTMVGSTPLVILFELGPIATALLVPGFLAFRRENPAEADRIVWLGAASFGFSVLIVHGSLLPLFLLFALAPWSLLAARGLQRMLPAARAGARSWLVPACACAVMLVPHAIRLWSYGHPIGPKRWTVLEEDGSRPFKLLRRFDRPYEARDFGLGALRIIPQGALVVGDWRELPILYYYCLALGKRGDLSFQPLSQPACEAAVRAWERVHDVSQRPVIYLTMPATLRGLVSGLDSLGVAPGRWIYRTHEPIRGRSPGGMLPS